MSFDFNGVFAPLDVRNRIAIVVALREASVGSMFPDVRGMPGGCSRLLRISLRQTYARRAIRSRVQTLYTPLDGSECAYRHSWCECCLRYEEYAINVDIFIHQRPMIRLNFLPSMPNIMDTSGAVDCSMVIIIGLRT